MIGGARPLPRCRLDGRECATEGATHDVRTHQCDGRVSALHWSALCWPNIVCATGGMWLGREGLDDSGARGRGCAELADRLVEPPPDAYLARFAVRDRRSHPLALPIA